MNIKAMKKCAQEATPGPWESDGMNYVWKTKVGGRDGEVEHMISDLDITRARGTGAGLTMQQQKANLAHIAASNPQAVLKLIDKLEKAERLVEIFDEEAPPIRAWEEVEHLLNELRGDQ